MSSVTLTCMVTSNDGSTFTVTSYSWDTTGCFTPDSGDVRCFPRNQLTAIVSEDSLLARDSGTITCTATVDGTSFTSPSLTLRISGVYVITSVIVISQTSIYT